MKKKLEKLIWQRKDVFVYLGSGLDYANTKSRQGTVFNSLSLSNHCSLMNRCPCSECWDLDIPVDFSDDWMLHLMFYVFGMCRNFKTQKVLGQEQFKFIVVSEIELNILKIKTCTVPMNLRYFAREECDLSWFSVSFPIKPMWKTGKYWMLFVNYRELLLGLLYFLNVLKLQGAISITVTSL